jgi:septal ring factor EnvC (AmiA/AmiB activator)
VTAALRVATLSVLAALAGMQAQQPEELAAVREQIRAMEQSLQALVRQQTDLTRERQRLEAELRLAELRVREGEVEHRAALAAERQAAQRAAQSQTALGAAAERLRDQITLLALLGRTGTSPLVYHAILGGSDLQHRITVLRAMALDQRRHRDEMARLAEERAAALSLLSLRRQQDEDSVEKLQGRKRELEVTRSRVQAQLVALERRRRSEAVKLATAHESEARLERLWGAVTRQARPASTDITLLRGGLPWPVTAFHIVRPFGPSRDPHYGTVTVSHGLRLAVPAGERVHAVAAGTVAYAQFFKGYGNLVIVNHGARVYSLYAQLSAMLVRPDQRVAMGDEVGIVGPDQNGDGNFYLEVRIGEEAKDPLGWLRPVQE